MRRRSHSRLPQARSAGRSTSWSARPPNANSVYQVRRYGVLTADDIASANRAARGAR